jgi:threonine aldolase
MFIVMKQDAAQSVFQKRLMPLAKDETFFSAQQLQDAIERMPGEEVFKSGIGAVSIENPVRKRRANGALEEIRKISAYCRRIILSCISMERGFIWHRHGRVFQLKEYASYF